MNVTVTAPAALPPRCRGVSLPWEVSVAPGLLHSTQNMDHHQPPLCVCVEQVFSVRTIEGWRAGSDLKITPSHNGVLVILYICLFFLSHFWRCTHKQTVEIRLWLLQGCPLRHGCRASEPLRRLRPGMALVRGDTATRAAPDCRARGSPPRGPTSAYGRSSGAGPASPPAPGAAPAPGQPRGLNPALP